MLSREMYTDSYIRDLHDRTGNDPALLERVVFAFGLLEAIRSVGLPFCFKGGTSLMLLLDKPGRLSTDIDIIVEPGTDIDGYIRRAGEIFPFTDAEEQIRIGKNNIVKRHFRFKYRSPQKNKDVTILLDVVFEKILYSKTVECPIKNALLLTEGSGMSVTIPDVNGILGDKLTAFAPHTTGILFGKNKELEIIKQLFDCGMLFDHMNDYKAVCDSYEKTVKAEMEYRGLSVTTDDVLRDTIEGCLCIAGRGGSANDDYEYYKDGILRIRNHILGGRFNADIAGAYAGKVLYLASSMLLGMEEVKKITDPGIYLRQSVSLPKPKRFSYLRYVDPASYGYVVETGLLYR